MLITMKKKLLIFNFFLFLTSILPLFTKDIHLKELEEIHPWFITVDRGGNIYAASFNESTIYKFSYKGEMIFKVGEKKGRSSQYIKRLARFEINEMNGKLYVPELPGGNKRISMFDMVDGRYVGRYDADLNWKFWSGLLKIRFDSLGNAYVDAKKTKYKEEKEYFWIMGERCILKFSPEGKYIGVIWKAEEDVQVSAIGRPSLKIPFRNYLIWDLWKDMIIVGKSHSNIINLLNTNGKILKKISLPINKEKIKKADIEKWKKWQKIFDVRIKNKIIATNSLDFLIERMKIPQYKPLISGFEFDKRGNVVIFRFNNYGENKREWIKIDLKTGKEIKRIVTCDEFLFVDERFIYIRRKLSEKKSKIFKIKREEYGF